MGRKASAKVIMKRLAEVIPNPETELVHENPYQLLVSVILSAQCTDARVNEATPALFQAFPAIADLAAADAVDVLPRIASISFPNNKSRHLVGMGRAVRDRFGGEIPREVEALQTLSGVGRKTAQVVAGAAFGADSMPVDTHVFRVAHRLELVRPSSATPDAVEHDLRRILQAGTLTRTHHLLILHGRYTCKAQRPSCTECAVSSMCPQWSRVQRLPEPKPGLDRRRGKFWCATRKHGVDHTVPRKDRSGVVQESCPTCGSMNLFDTGTGRTLKRVRDARIGDLSYGRPRPAGSHTP
jgi:endonuclease III